MRSTMISKFFGIVGKVLKWFRNQRANRVKLAKKNAREYYGRPKLVSLDAVIAELAVLRSGTKAARALGTVASSVWRSKKKPSRPDGGGLQLAAMCGKLS